MHKLLNSDFTIMCVFLSSPSGAEKKLRFSTSISNLSSVKKLMNLVGQK